MHTEKIISIRRVQPEPVFNVAVAVDESYIANGITVHNCRSRLVPYFGKIPGERDYSKQFSTKMLANARKTQDTFISQYWTHFPRTKASAPFQRSYFDKKDILLLRDGLNTLTKAQRKTMQPNIIPLKALKDRIRYRKIDADTSTIVDAFGKSMLFDKIERHTLKDSMHALIKISSAKRDKYSAKGLDVLATMEQHKIDRYIALLDRIV